VNVQSLDKLLKNATVRRVSPTSVGDVGIQIDFSNGALLDISWEHPDAGLARVVLGRSSEDVTPVVGEKSCIQCGELIKNETTKVLDDGSAVCRHCSGGG
jgi:hypothetical protein